MKKIYTLIIALLICKSITSVAQCASSVSSYDLTVSTNMVLHPTGSSYFMIAICPGAVLLDSMMCCTRFIHIPGGAVYQAGPMAYGIVYIQSGGTFDAQNFGGSFSVYYEAGANILNFTGPAILCSSVSFPPMLCVATSTNEINMEETMAIYPNPTTNQLTVNSEQLIVKEIKLFNVLGKEVFQSEIQTPKSEINLKGIDKGIYFVEIKTDVKIVKKKIVIN